MKLNLILFDFDGTVADTFSETVRIFNHFADKYGYYKVADEELEMARGMNIWQLLKFVRIPKHKLPFLLRKGRARLYKNLDKIEVFEGIRDILELAQSHSIPCGIVTSNSKKNVDRFVQLNQLPNVHFIRSSSRLLGKPREFRHIMKKRKVNKDSILYIGDETRDIQSARECGIEVVAVTWGYNSRSALIDQKPDHLADSPETLHAIVKDRLEARSVPMESYSTSHQ